MAIGSVGIATAPRRLSLRSRISELLDRESWLGPIFVSPAMVLLLLLVAYPFCMALYFSVSNAFIGRPSSFIGIRNFINLWDSDAFRQTFQNAFVFCGLVAIPKELYEAAEADGAGPIARFWHVTLPLLKGVLAIVVLFSTIFTFSEFNIIYVLTHGGPINSTHLFATLARQVGLETGRIGEGAAISLYLFPALMLVVWAQLRYVRKQAY